MEIQKSYVPARSSKKVPKKAFDPKSLRRVVLDKTRFIEVRDFKTFNPQALSPIPEPQIARQNNQWWIRCVEGDMINAEACYQSFLNINALYQKNHACWNCGLGKVYREMHAEGNFKATQFDTLLQ